MKILLLQPPLSVAEDRLELPYDDAGSEPNLGLGDLAASLIAKGFDDVEIRNFQLDSWDVVSRYLKSIPSLDKNPLVGINCFSDTRQATFKLSRLAKKIIPGCTVVAGGVHASIFYENILKKHPAIDAIVVGEGEKALLEIAGRVRRGEPLSDDIRGVALRKNAEIVFTGPPESIKNIDELPMTAHHLYDIDALRWNHDFNPVRNRMLRFIPKDAPFTPKMWYMNTSRGCLGKCQFCTGNRFWRGTWRARSPKLVVDEMEYLHEKFGVNLISFFDGCFITNRRRVEQICEEIATRKLRIHWTCLTRVDNIGDRELLKAMRKAGCIGICFGIESGSPTILRNIKKNCDIAQAKNALRMVREAGIKTLCFYIIGNFGETDRTIGETIDFIKKVKSDIISVGYNLIFPGTELYETAKGRGWIDDAFWDGYEHSPYFTHEHSLEKLASYNARILFAHYFSRLTSGDLSALRQYFLTKHFMIGLTYLLKLRGVIGFVRRRKNKKASDPANS